MGKLKRPSALANVRGYNSALGEPNNDPEVKSSGVASTGWGALPSAPTGDGTIGHADAMKLRGIIKPEPSVQIPQKQNPEVGTKDDPFAPKPPGGQDNMHWKIVNGELVRRTPGEISDFIRAQDKKLADEKAGKKAEPQEPDKELWSKWHEARANKANNNGGVLPDGWFSAAPKNVGGNPARIPEGMKDQFRTEWGDTAPKQRSGLSSDEEWAKLFPKTWTADDTAKTRTENGVYQERGIGKDGNPGTGNWVDMSRPLGSGDILNHHFAGKWADATPEDRATLLRGELGIPPVGQWWTPDQTAEAVGAGTGTPFSPLPSNTIRTASKDGKIVGFATSGPSLPAANPVAPVANANLQLPGFDPLFPDAMPGQLPKPIIPES
jgi:hypothetical protein